MRRLCRLLLSCWLTRSLFPARPAYSGLTATTLAVDVVVVALPAATLMTAGDVVVTVRVHDTDPPVVGDDPVGHPRSLLRLIARIRRCPLLV